MAKNGVAILAFTRRTRQRPFLQGQGQGQGAGAGAGAEGKHGQERDYLTVII